MNAAEQATSLEVTAQIASLVTLFKGQFSDVKADLKPWHNDPDTQEWLDPDSIDIGFHLPGWSPRYQCRSILVQVRRFKDPQSGNQRLIGIEAVGFSHAGEQWRLSTVADWQFVGEKQPTPEIADRLKCFCRQAFELFHGAISPPDAADESNSDAA